MNATVENANGLEAKSNAVNNGRTDGIYFYVNGNHVSVSHPYVELSELRQEEELDWFLTGRVYSLSN